MSGKSSEPASDSIEPQAYRTLMRQQAGAVTVIAVGRPGDRTGLTATAVCSVSDSPPTLLICVNRNASAHRKIAAEGAFSVNVLARDQEALALKFSGRAGLEGEARFEAAEWTTAATGAPVLKRAIASLDCELVEEHMTATHSIYLGRVRAGHAREDAEPLIYFRGAFCTVSGS